MRTGCRFAREAYIAAVYPAGPEPIIRQSIKIKYVVFENRGKGSKIFANMQIFLGQSLLFKPIDNMQFVKKWAKFVGLKKKYYFCTEKENI
jgi:hypothetical protein